MIRNVLAALMALSILSACGGAGSTIPGAPLAPSQTPVDGAGRSRHGQATFRIRIPPCKERAHCRRHAHWISPATQSIVIAIDAYAPIVQNLTPTSANCSVGGPISYLVCQFSVTVTTGPHTFSATTFDGLNGNGNALSADLNVPVTIVGGSNQGVGLTLGGIAQSLVVLAPPNSPHVTGSQFDGFSVYGNLPVPFSVIPVDADGNYIVGPGAPVASLLLPPNAPITIASSPSAPSTLSLTSTYQPTNPTIAKVVRAMFVAAPVANSGGSTVQTPVTLALYQPWVYVTNQNSSTVGITDESGNGRIVPAGAFASVPDPSGIAYDPHDYWPYIPSIDDDTVCVYNVLGALVYDAYGGWNGLNSPTDIVYAPTPYGDRLYIVNESFDDVVRSHGRHRAASLRPHPEYQTGVTAYSEFGTYQELASDAFGGLEGPISIAYDSNNANLYVTDDGVGGILQFDTQGDLLNTLTAPTSTDWGGITFDSHNKLFYVVDNQHGKIVAFNESGVVQTLPAGAFPNTSSPYAIRYDPYNGLIYVGNNQYPTAGRVTIYNERGAQQKPIAGFTSGGTSPWGIAIVP
jgi:hypothetical protein